MDPAVQTPRRNCIPEPLCCGIAGSDPRTVYSAHIHLPPDRSPAVSAGTLQALVRALADATAHPHPTGITEQ